MNVIPASALAILLIPFGALAAGATPPDSYVPGPDSAVQPGVPQGEIIRFDFSSSRVFPGTTRHVAVYVPRQYDPATPACVYISQDGIQWNAPVVLDNLIARKEVPVMIGVFITPGVVGARDPATALARYNRSLEYDGLGDAYSRLLLDEVLPQVETKATADGRPIRLSHSGNDRAIAGSSSGAIAAFTAAWEHPEAFSRVLSAIGTYVGLRGGEVYPTLIRKYEPKPIRVFLQDGSGDLNIYGGDWWMANQTMERALEFSGYEVTHVWGDGAHSGRQIASILPDALRWLWKDWPKPVARGESRNGALKAILLPGEDWQVEAHLAPAASAPAFDTQGAIFYPSAPGRAVVRLGPDGRFYSADRNGVIAYRRDSKVPSPAVAYGLAAGDLAAAHNGNLYVTEVEGRVWLVRPDGTKSIVDSGLGSATGVTLSPDQSLLYVADGGSHWIYSYQVQPDGTLGDRQRYFWLHTADSEDASHAGGMCCDQAGWLYVATGLGIQVCDQAGRVNAILPTPAARPASVCFGGARFDTLYATCGDTVYRRRMNATAANTWAAPTLPPVPKL